MSFPGLCINTLNALEQTSSSLGHLLGCSSPNCHQRRISIGISEGWVLLPGCDRQLPAALQSDKVFTRMKAASKVQVFNSISCCFFFVLSNQLCLASLFGIKATRPFLVPFLAHAPTASVLSPTLFNPLGCHRDFPPCSFCRGFQILSIPWG